MTSRADKVSLRCAVVAGVLHLLGIVALARMVLVYQQTSASYEAWGYASIFDMPVNFLALLIGPLIARVESWPDVPFLPGIAGNWAAFLFPLLFYGILGTAFWSFFGYALAQIITRWREPSS
jgi:hypothetical protein